MFKLAPLTAQMLAVVAAGAMGNALAAENPVELPTATVSASPDTVEAPAKGYQAKPASTSTRLNMTAKETPQGVTSVTREQLDVLFPDPESLDALLVGMQRLTASLLAMVSILYQGGLALYYLNTRTVARAVVAEPPVLGPLPPPAP